MLPEIIQPETATNPNSRYRETYAPEATDAASLTAQQIARNLTLELLESGETLTETQQLRELCKDLQKALASAIASAYAHKAESIETENENTTLQLKICHLESELATLSDQVGGRDHFVRY